MLVILLYLNELRTKNYVDGKGIVEMGLCFVEVLSLGCHQLSNPQATQNARSVSFFPGFYRVLYMFYIRIS
jgi:hypothetical protein